MAAPPAEGPLDRLALAPDRGFLVRASLVGVVAVALACLVLHVLSLAGIYGQLSDSLFITPYWTDASLVHAGMVPYHDFELEYPPLSLPIFLLPAALPGGGLDYPTYRTMFEVLMALCAVGLVPLTAWTIARVGGRRGDVALGIGLVVVAPVMLGPLTISRYDLWPALLTAAATLAMVSGRPRIAFALLALGTLAKVYPVFLVPIFAWYAWRAAGGREAVIAVAIGAFVGLAGLGPFLAIDPAGTLAPFVRTLERPLQVESLGASILTTLHTWFGLHIGPFAYGFDSYNLIGVYTGDISSFESGLLLGGLVLVWSLAAMGPARPDRLVIASAAALALTVALGKVLSPQYVLWLLAAIAVLASPAPRALIALAAAILLTQVYFPARYPAYLTGDPGATLTVLERNLALLGLALYLVVVTWRSTRLPAPAPPSPPPSHPSASPPPDRHPGPPADRAPVGA